MPNPNDYDNREDFLAVCIPTMIDEGRDQDQAVAACNSIWDDHNKESKSMQKQIFKYSNIEVKSSDEDKREITAIASKEVADRDGDIVRVGKTPKEGINITEYKKNPVILFGHNSHDLPVAKATKIWKDNKHLMVKIQFPEPEVSSTGDTIYKLIKNDYLRALSIGFRPNWDEAVRMEKTGGYDFKSSDLFEISIVPVGANQAALVQTKEIKKAIDDGIIDELELGELELLLQDLDFDYKIDETLKNLNEEMDEEIVEDENITDEHLQKIEQNDEEPTLKDEEFDPYAYIFDSVEDEVEDEEEKNQDIYDEIYDLLIK